MLPLAMILRNQGFSVSGSDRSFDQGLGAEKAAFLRSLGILLFPQDGSGIINSDVVLVTSTAVEDSIPDVRAALEKGAGRISRARLLGDLFNRASTPIGVAGTSGKSTTTAMIGWILNQAGLDPTIVNGAVMKNFVAPGMPFASALVGKGAPFLCEVDESDGSIANFSPKIAVVNNITLDHKPLEELQALFGDFCGKSDCAILNLDNPGTRLLAENLPTGRRISYSLIDPDADLFGTLLHMEPESSLFRVTKRKNDQKVDVRLPVPGSHNVANAIAAIAASLAVGLSLAQAAKALENFSGVKRRLEFVGRENNIAVIDDFAHNPDKIAATLATLHTCPGRLLILFQPHGYGPLRLMKEEFIASFAEGLSRHDVLAITEPVYFGGTVDRSVNGEQIAKEIAAKGKNVLYDKNRNVLAQRLVKEAQQTDCIVIMGARDDSLSQLAEDVLNSVKQKETAS